MSEPLASHSFLPWLRRGVGAEITRVDGGGTPERRAKIAVEVRFNGDDAKKGSVDLELFGPGEVRGFDARSVIRTWPRAGVMDAEPNYFPLVEFDQPDLPWRYTPARPSSGDRLTPWITLIVLADDEIDSILPAKGTALGLLKIKNATVLPKHGQLWAWTHVQVTGEAGVSEARVAELLATDPRRVIARMMSPRRMKPHLSYTAFVVPSFQRGVVAGMGQDPADGVDGLAPAWDDTTTGPLTLPIYYQWRFGTGLAGDFEALARRIKKFATPPTIGIRNMDVSVPSPGAPPVNNVPLGMLGMLRGLTTPTSPWSDPARGTWIAWMKQLLNLPVDRLRNVGGRPIVTPPLYGQWHAAADRCAADNPSARPTWFQSLSVDARYRVAAALGTQVVQANQEALMASAWQQVDRIRQLNEELRQAQLAREAAAQLMKRHIESRAPDAVLSLTAPVATRIKASPRTVRAVLNDSPIPRGIFHGAFRRVARPLGPARRRQSRVEGAQPHDSLIDRLNTGNLSAARTPKAPSDMSTPRRNGGGLGPAATGVSTVAERQRRLRFVRWILLLLIVLALFLLGAGFTTAAIVLVAIALVGFLVTSSRLRTADDAARRIAFRDGVLSGADVREAPPASGYQPSEAPPQGVPNSPPVVQPGATPPSAELVAAMRESLARMYDRVAAPITPGPVLQSVSVKTLSATVVTALDPRRTIPAAYAERIMLGNVQWAPDDPIEPVMAAPEFPQPMYVEVKKLSVEWLLPGFSQIPPNIATLLLTSSEMVEAFMVGLNHEMARELLWREYPTDQRGTYFRQFWDTAGFVPQPGESLDQEALKDITRIHTWPKASGLGTHSPRPAAPASDYLVLLVRGDLLRRYPNTVIYAARAKWNAAGQRDIDDPPANATDAQIAQLQSWPLFSGVLDPDGTFFGFRLTVPQVKGAADPSGDPGWFFVLQEHSSEPKFGLDEADPTQLGVAVSGSDWNNLSWGSLVADAAALDALTAIDLDAALPNTTLVSDPTTKRWHADQGTGQIGSRSSDLAYITFQRPMRVGIHGADMIP